MAPRTREEALSDPSGTNAAIDRVVHYGKEAPLIEPAPDDTVRLPGGLVRGGSLVRTATVRELNGSDEEALSRALKSGSAYRFMDTLIECGTVSVGGVKADQSTLKGLLAGDRDELALAIRRVTYGEEMDIERWVCPACGKQSDISFTLTDDVIDRKTLGPDGGVFEIALRKGAKARVRFPTGADQDALFADEDWTAAQRNTVLISRCVMSYTDPAGQEFNMAAFPSMSRTMSIPDRQTIIREITERQPGPRYNEVKFRHDECGNEVILALGVTDLFRDLIRFL